MVRDLARRVAWVYAVAVVGGHRAPCRRHPGAKRLWRPSGLVAPARAATVIGWVAASIWAFTGATEPCT